MVTKNIKCMLDFPVFCSLAKLLRRFSDMLRNRVIAWLQLLEALQLTSYYIILQYVQSYQTVQCSKYWLSNTYSVVQCTQCSVQFDNDMTPGYGTYYYYLLIGKVCSWVHCGPLRGPTSNSRELQSLTYV